MSQAKIYEITTIFFLVMLLVFMRKNPVYAASGDINNFLSTLKKTTNGPKVQWNYNSDNSVDISVNSQNLKKGYYTAYIYKNMKADYSDYNILAFYIENKSPSNLRLNFNIQNINGTVSKVKGDVMLQSDKSEDMEKVTPSYGAIEVDKDFKGIMYIPFTSFDHEISSISSLGIVVAVEENQQESFNIGKFSLMKKNALVEEYKNLQISIKGDNQVQIPVVGESIAQYRAEVTGANKKKCVKFILDKPMTGVTVSNEGRLVLTPQAPSGKITLTAVIDNKLIQNIEINLFKSWTITAKEVDGTSKSIPKPSEVPKIIGDRYEFFTQDRVLNIIRIIFVVVIMLFTAVILYWKKGYRQKT